MHRLLPGPAGRGVARSVAYALSLGAGRHVQGSVVAVVAGGAAGQEDGQRSIEEKPLEHRKTPFWQCALAGREPLW